MSDIVYVLTNAAMPGLVKIGSTSREHPEVRMNELYSTGVPVPFQCEYAVRLDYALDIERALHVAFDDFRLNPKREFFEIDADKILAILHLFDGEEVTPQINEESESLTKEEQASSKNLARSKRPNFDFSEMGIPLGSTLTFKPRSGEETDEVVEVEVVGAKKVLFDDEEVSLTRATKIALGTDKTVSPTWHWYYEDRLLNEIWREWADSEWEWEEELVANRRPNLNFFEMNIPSGSILTFKHSDDEEDDEVIEVEVVDAKKVLFDDEEMSLTRATKLVLETDKAVSPTWHWYYKGRLLNEIWREWADSEQE